MGFLITLAAGALVVTACGSASAPSPSAVQASDSPASPKIVATSRAVKTCIILAQSRFLDDHLSTVVIQSEGDGIEDCAATVEQDNNRDDWGRAHPEVVLANAPTSAPLCAEVVDGVRWTVWGNSIAATTFCRTLRFEASPAPAT